MPHDFQAARLAGLDVAPGGRIKCRPARERQKRTKRVVSVEPRAVEFRAVARNSVDLAVKLSEWGLIHAHAESGISSLPFHTGALAGVAWIRTVNGPALMRWCAANRHGTKMEVTIGPPGDDSAIEIPAELPDDDGAELAALRSIISRLTHELAEAKALEKSEKFAHGQTTVALRRARALVEELKDAYAEAIWHTEPE